MSTIEDAITRFRGRCKIALSSDSQYDEFVIVENDADASWLVNLCDSYDQLAHQRDELRRALDECATRFERCCIHSGSDKEFAASAVADYRALLTKLGSAS